MIVRPCTESDASGIESLFQEFAVYLRSIGDKSDYRFGARQYLADGFGSNPAFRGLVADDGSELIGYVLFCHTYDCEYLRNFYIVDLYVQRASRGKGVGMMLMDEVMKLASAEGVARLSWAVHRNNAGAIRFYEALGAKYTSDTHLMYLDLT